MASSSTTTSQALLLPGQPLSVSKTTTPSPQLGPGTYTRGDHILSSLVGYEQRTVPAAPSSSLLKGKAKGAAAPAVQAATLSVHGAENSFVVPRPDSIVIARVTRVTPRQAHLSILIVDGQPCGSSSSTSSASIATGRGNHAAGEGEGTDFQGVVRSQDVRNTEKDKISLGDARSYYLSTAANNLGVIYATSSSSSLAGTPGAGAAAASGPGWEVTGNPMQPISWQELVDPITGVVEKRKCAKPDGI
ncbi:related to CSL4 - exosome core component [Pseudozyma flocculosa]|uniref:Related to CSL4 - exosome core component n=1 Tax=Pseudozyma flocculosa TaxID=84751 RepID=A0A5C3F7S6_9BASI|nr:related to CSL4 - exosome core component [Pseudozyma flocculosa]